MFSSNTIKFFFVLALLIFQSCGFWRGKADANATPTPFVAEEIKSEIPFSTKEPESFQAEIVVTTVGGSEDKTFTAKSGANRIITFDYQTRAETALLQTGANKSFLIAHSQKIYVENEPGIAAVQQTNPNDFLTAELLNQKKDVKFETLGAENNIIKYRVILDETGKSEIIISVDEKIGLPVKQEFYTIAGEQKVLTSTMELRNFTTQTEAKFFEVPKDYKKVSPKEFREIIQRERIK